jgi:Ca2+-binding RTX toxin-like protein
MPGAPDDAVDFLNGGEGNDLLMLGAGDYGNGGEGEDAFVLQDYDLAGGPAHITDFNREEDELVVLYDASRHPDPQLTLVEQEGSASATLCLDGVPLAEIANAAGLDLSTVMLRAA